MANDTAVRCVLFHHSSTSCNAYKPQGTTTLCRTPSAHGAYGLKANVQRTVGWR